MSVAHGWQGSLAWIWAFCLGVELDSMLQLITAPLQPGHLKSTCAPAVEGCAPEDRPLVHAAIGAVWRELGAWLGAFRLERAGADASEWLPAWHTAPEDAALVSCAPHLQPGDQGRSGEIRGDECAPHLQPACPAPAP